MFISLFPWIASNTIMSLNIPFFKHILIVFFTGSVNGVKGDVNDLHTLYREKPVFHWGNIKIIRILS